MSTDCPLPLICIIASCCASFSYSTFLCQPFPITVSSTCVRYCGTSFIPSLCHKFHRLSFTAVLVFFISFMAALDKNCFPVGQRKVSCARKEKLQTYFPCKNKQTKKTHIPTNQTGDTLPVQAILMPCSACLLFAESEQHSEILPFCLVGVIHAG